MKSVEVLLNHALGILIVVVLILAAWTVRCMHCAYMEDPYAVGRRAGMQLAQSIAIMAIFWGVVFFVVQADWILKIHSGVGVIKFGAPLELSWVIVQGLGAVIVGASLVLIRRVYSGRRIEDGGKCCGRDRR